MRKVTGFTLIEVLVTMLILAIGLLGIAALQLKGLQFNHDSALRSQISNLAYDIADRMRLADSVDATLPGSYVGNYATVVAAPCSVAQQAVYPTTTAAVVTDLNCWRQSVNNALPPTSTANIGYNVGSDQYTVALGWSDREGQAHNINYTFSL